MGVGPPAEDGAVKARGPVGEVFADDSASEDTDTTTADLLGHGHAVKARLDGLLADLVAVLVDDVSLVALAQILRVRTLQWLDLLLDKVV